MSTKGNEEETLRVATQTTEQKQKAIQKLLGDTAHIVMVDGIHDLIRNDLEKRRLLDVKEELCGNFYT